MVFTVLVDTVLAALKKWCGKGTYYSFRLD